MGNLDDFLSQNEKFQLKVNSWLVRFQAAFARKDSEQSAEEDASFVLQLLEYAEIINAFPEAEKRNIGNFIISISELLTDKKELHPFIEEILKKQDAIVSLPTDMKLLIVKRILEILQNIANEEKFLCFGNLFFGGQTLEKFGYSRNKPNPVVDAGKIGLLRSRYLYLSALKSAKEFHEEIVNRANEMKRKRMHM